MDKTKDQLREEFNDVYFESEKRATDDKKGIFLHDKHIGELYTWIEEHWTPKNEDHLIFISGEK